MARERLQTFFSFLKRTASTLRGYPLEGDASETPSDTDTSSSRLFFNDDPGCGLLENNYFYLQPACAATAAAAANIPSTALSRTAAAATTPSRTAAPLPPPEIRLHNLRATMILQQLGLATLRAQRRHSRGHDEEDDEAVAYHLMQERSHQELLEKLMQQLRALEDEIPLNRLRFRRQQRLHRRLLRQLYREQQRERQQRSERRRRAKVESLQGFPTSSGSSGWASDETGGLCSFSSNDTDVQGWWRTRSLSAVSRLKLHLSKISSTTTTASTTADLPEYSARSSFTTQNGSFNDTARLSSSTSTEVQPAELEREKSLLRLHITRLLEHQRRTQHRQERYVTRQRLQHSHGVDLNYVYETTLEQQARRAQQRWQGEWWELQTQEDWWQSQQQQRAARQPRHCSLHAGPLPYTPVRVRTPQGYTITQRRRTSEQCWFGEHTRRALAAQLSQSQGRPCIWWQRQQQEFAEEYRQQRYRWSSAPHGRTRREPGLGSAEDTELRWQITGPVERKKEPQQHDGKDPGGEKQQPKRPSVQLQRFLSWRRRRGEQRSNSSVEDEQQQASGTTREQERPWRLQLRIVEQGEQVEENVGQAGGGGQPRSKSEQQQKRTNSVRHRTAECEEESRGAGARKTEGCSRGHGSPQQVISVGQENEQQQQQHDFLAELYTSEANSQTKGSQAVYWQETDVGDGADALPGGDEVFPFLFQRLDTGMSAEWLASGEMHSSGNGTSAATRRAAAWHQLAARDEGWSPSVSTASGPLLQQHCGSSFEDVSPAGAFGAQPCGAAGRPAGGGSSATQVDAVRRHLAASVAAAQQEEWQHDQCQQEQGMQQDHCHPEDEEQHTTCWQFQRQQHKHWQQRHWREEDLEQGEGPHERQQHGQKPLQQGDEDVSLDVDNERGEGETQQHAQQQTSAAERMLTGARRPGRPRWQQLLWRRRRSAGEHQEPQMEPQAAATASSQQPSKQQHAGEVGSDSNGAAAAGPEQHLHVEAEGDMSWGGSRRPQHPHSLARGPQVSLSEGYSQSPGRRFWPEDPTDCVLCDADEQHQQHCQEKEAALLCRAASEHRAVQANADACKDFSTEQQREDKPPQRQQRAPQWQEYSECEKRSGEQPKDGHQATDEQQQSRCSTHSSQGWLPPTLQGCNAEEQQVSSSHQKGAPSQRRNRAGAAGDGLAAGATASHLPEAGDGVTASSRAEEATGTVAAAYTAAAATAATPDAGSSELLATLWMPRVLFHRRGEQNNSLPGAVASRSPAGNSDSVTCGNATSSNGSSGRTGSLFRKRGRVRGSSGRRSWHCDEDSCSTDGPRRSSWCSVGNSGGSGSGGGSLGEGGVSSCVPSKAVASFERETDSNAGMDKESRGVNQRLHTISSGATRTCSGSSSATRTWSNGSSASRTWSSSSSATHTWSSSSSAPRTWSDELLRVSGGTQLRVLVEQRQVQSATAARGAADVEEAHSKSNRWLTGLLLGRAHEAGGVVSLSSGGSGNESNTIEYTEDGAPAAAAAPAAETNATIVASTAGEMTDTNQQADRNRQTDAAKDAEGEEDVAAAGTSEEEKAAEAEAAMLEQMYDDAADERDEQWVRKHLRVGDKESDGMLACPGCFTPVCYQCRRDEMAFSLYRAVAASNVDVDRVQLQELCCGGGRGAAAAATAACDEQVAGGRLSVAPGLSHGHQRQQQKEEWRRLQRILQQQAANKEQQENGQLQQKDEEQQEERQLQERNERQGGRRARCWSPLKKKTLHGGVSAFSSEGRMQCRAKEEMQQQQRLPQEESQQPDQEHQTEKERRSRCQEQVQRDQQQQQELEHQQQRGGLGEPERQRHRDIPIIKHLLGMVSPVERRNDGVFGRGNSCSRSFDNRKSSSACSRGWSERAGSGTASLKIAGGEAESAADVEVDVTELPSGSSLLHSNNKSACRKNGSVREILELLEEPGVAAAVTASTPKGQTPVLHALRCGACSTTLGVFEARSRIYLFFRVLPGEA